MSVAVAVGVGVAVGTAGVEVGVDVPTCAVGVAEGAAVTDGGTGVEVRVGVDVAMAVAVAVLVSVPGVGGVGLWGVPVGVMVGVFVRVLVAVAVLVAVRVGVLVGVLVGVFVGGGLTVRLVCRQELMEFGFGVIDSTSAAWQDCRSSKVSPNECPCTKKSIEATTPEPSGPGGVPSPPPVPQAKSQRTSLEPIAGGRIVGGWQMTDRPVLPKKDPTRMPASFTKLGSNRMTNSKPPRFATLSRMTFTVKGVPAPPVTFIVSGSSRITAAGDERAGSVFRTPTATMSARRAPKPASLAATDDSAANLRRCQIRLANVGFQNRPGLTTLAFARQAAPQAGLWENVPV